MGLSYSLIGEKPGNGGQVRLRLRFNSIATTVESAEKSRPNFKSQGPSMRSNPMKRTTEKK
jgi:hypothetical protein